MDPDQVGIAVTTDPILEQSARQASDRAEGRAGRPEPDTPDTGGTTWSFIRLTDTACTPTSVNLLESQPSSDTDVLGQHSIIRVHPLHYRPSVSYLCKACLPSPFVLSSFFLNEGRIEALNYLRRGESWIIYLLITQWTPRATHARVICSWDQRVSEITAAVTY